MGDGFLNVFFQNVFFIIFALIFFKQIRSLEEELADSQQQIEDFHKEMKKIRRGKWTKLSFRH